MSFLDIAQVSLYSTTSNVRWPNGFFFFLQSFVVVEILGAVRHGEDLFHEFPFEAVDVDGGLLLEDGAAERGREGQDDAAQRDLKRGADARVSEIKVNTSLLVHDRFSDATNCKKIEHTRKFYEMQRLDLNLSKL